MSTFIDDEAKDHNAFQDGQQPRVGGAIDGRMAMSFEETQELCNLFRTLVRSSAREESAKFVRQRLRRAKRDFFREVRLTAERRATETLGRLAERFEASAAGCFLRTQAGALESVVSHRIPDRRKSVAIDANTIIGRAALNGSPDVTILPSDRLFESLGQDSDWFEIAIPLVSPTNATVIGVVWFWRQEAGLCESGLR